MKLCIPTLDDKGLQGTPSDHFGSAPFFTFVDTDTGDIEIQGNGGDHHVHGACRPLEHLGAREVDVVVCRGLGKRAFSRLSSGGIGVYVTQEKDVDATIQAYEAGRLTELTIDEACGGHGHGHGGGSGHGHFHGHGGGSGHGHGEGSGHGRARTPGSGQEQ